MARAEEPLVFVIPGDLHLTESGLENHRIAEWVVEQVNDLIRPDFVQFIGDNVQHATIPQFGLFNGLCSKLNVPHFALVGDHDVHKDAHATGFRQQVGEPCGQLSLKGFRCIRLNTQEFKPNGMTPEQLRWFEDQVIAAERAGERVLLFQHNYPYQIWEDFTGPGIDCWRAILQTRRIAGVFCGHTHYLQIANDGRNAAVAVRSIGDPEGGPPGYLLGYAHGDDLAVTYRSVEDRGPIVLVTHPRDVLLATEPRHIVSADDTLGVRVWSTSTLRCVRAQLDGSDWTDLKNIAGDQWTREFAVDALTKGEHEFNVRALERWVRQAARPSRFTSIARGGLPPCPRSGRSSNRRHSAEPSASGNAPLHWPGHRLSPNC